MPTVTKRRPYAARVPREVRREQLLDAAIAIIDRDGYGGVSIDAIAREVGVTRPVVYGVFDGLGPLLSALLDRQESRALGQLEDAFAEASGAGSLDEIVVGTAVRMVEVVTSDPQTWRPILLAPHGTPESVVAMLNKALNESIAVPDFAKKLEPFGMTVPPPPNTPESYREFIVKQLAYQGKPLYTFVKDKKAGDRAGDKKMNVWRVVTD